MSCLSRKDLSCESVQLRNQSQHNHSQNVGTVEDPSKIQSLTLLYEFDAVSALSCQRPWTWLTRVCLFDSVPFLTSVPLAFR